MSRSKRKVGILLLVISLVQILAISAYASNYSFGTGSAIQDKTLSQMAATNTYYKYLYPDGATYTNALYDTGSSIYSIARVDNYSSSTTSYYLSARASFHSGNAQTIRNYNTFSIPAGSSNFINSGTINFIGTVTKIISDCDYNSYYITQSYDK